MRRLTEQINETTVLYVGDKKQYDSGDIPAEVSVAGVRDILTHLAAYESTGLLPHQIATTSAALRKLLATLKHYAPCEECEHWDYEHGKNGICVSSTICMCGEKWKWRWEKYWENQNEDNYYNHQASAPW